MRIQLLSEVVNAAMQTSRQYEWIKSSCEFRNCFKILKILIISTSAYLVHAGKYADIDDVVSDIIHCCDAPAAAAVYLADGLVDWTVGLGRILDNRLPDPNYCLSVEYSYIVTANNFIITSGFLSQV